MAAQGGDAAAAPKAHVADAKHAEMADTTANLPNSEHGQEDEWISTFEVCRLFLS